MRNQYLKNGTPWSCPECEKQANQAPPSIPNFNEETQESGKVKGEVKKSLRIMQWNADTISTKVLELKARLASDDIDICAIQETKLLESSRLPSFKKEGYETI